MPPAVDAQSPNHWTAREVLTFLLATAFEAFRVSILKVRTICRQKGRRLGFLLLKVPGARGSSSSMHPTHIILSLSKCPKAKGTHLFPSLTLNFLPSSSILYSVSVLMFPLMASLGGGSGAGRGENTRGTEPWGMGTRREGGWGEEAAQGWREVCHSPPGNSSGSGLVSPAARGIPLRSSLVTHLSVKGSVGNRDQMEGQELPNRNGGTFGMMSAPRVEKGGTKGRRLARKCPGIAIRGHKAGCSNFQQWQA